MNFVTILSFINLFFAGMLAGIEFVIHYGVHGPTEILDKRSQLQLRKAMVMKLRVLVPAFFAPMALSGIAITILYGTASGFWFRCAAMLALIIWISIRVVGTVPINSATVDWDIDAPPTDWKEQVTHAERFHIFGTWAAILAFIFFLISMALVLPTY